MDKRVSVTREDENGRNIRFHDNQTDRYMNREQFVSAIERGKYDDYHVRVINGIPTPCSNPNGNSRDNLD